MPTPSGTSGDGGTCPARGVFQLLNLQTSRQGLGYQLAQGNYADGPRVPELPLPGCCGSGGVQKIWAQNGNLNRSYDIMHAAGLGAPFALKASFDATLIGNTGSGLGSGWDLTATSMLSADGGGATVNDGDGTVARYGGTTYFSPDNGVFRNLSHSAPHYTERQWDGTNYTFDSNQSNRLTHITDTSGHTHDFHYDADLLTRIDFASGQSAYFAYDGSRISAIATPGDRVTYFDYTGDNLTGITGPDGCHSLFHYDANGNMDRAVDPLGVPIYYRYDGSDRVDAFLLDGASTYFNYDSPTQTTIVDGDGNPWEMHYSAPGVSVLSQVDPAGHAYNQVFDAQYELLVAQDRTGAATYFTYDGHGNALKQRDANGNLTYFAYDSQHRLLRQRNADASSSYYVYDGAGHLLRMSNPRRYPTYFAYDGAGQLHRERDALGGTTYFVYDTRGLNAVRVDPRHNPTYFTYDEANNRTAVKDALNGSSYFAYDKDNHVTRDMNARGDTAYFTYDARGSLTESIDRAGYATEMTYDAWAQLSTRTAPNGLVTSYAYDNEGRRLRESNDLGSAVYTSYYAYNNVGFQTQAIDPRGNPTLFGHDFEGRTTEQLDAAGVTTRYGYDPVGNLVFTTIDPYGYGTQSYGPSPYGGSEGRTTYFEYDSMNRKRAIRDPLGRSTYYRYDANGNQTRVLLPGMEATYYQYDALDRKITDFSPTGSATYYRYDANSNQTVVQNPRLYSTYYHYDALNRRDRVQDALEGVQYFVYDAIGNTTAQRDQNENWTYFEYDAMNREKQRVNALGSQWLKFYDAMGNLIQQQPPVGGNVTFSYDKLGRLTYNSDGAGDTTCFQYDAANNRTSVRSPRGYYTHFGYDALNRQNKSLNAIGGATYFAYDAVGNTTRVENPLQNTTYFSYDQLDRNVVIEDPMEGSVYFGYDQAGNQRLIEDALQHSTYFHYDKSNRLTSSADPLGNTAYWAYDKNSNLSRSRDNLGQGIYFTYDKLDRRTITRYTFGGGTSQYFAYDAVGNLTVMGDGWGPSYFGYDALNRLKKRVTPNVETVYYAYDAVSNVARLEYPETGTCHYAYDDAQRMSRLQTAQGNGCYYEYDQSSNVVNRQYGNGVVATMVYDEAERIKLLHYAKSDGEALTYFIYDWDVGSRITRIEREFGDAITYEYDANDRLTAEKWYDRFGAQNHAFLYDYDAAGNRLKERRESTVGTEFESAYYTYNDDNSLHQRQSMPSGVNLFYIYDANGALTMTVEGDDVTYITYGANQLIETIMPPSGFADQWKFYYDGQLNRYRIDKGTLGTRYLLWNGLNCLEERDDGGNLIVRYTYGQTPIYGIGSCVEVYIPGDDTYTIAMDHRGSAMWILDSSGDRIGWRLYNAFGEIIDSDGTWPTDFGYQTNWMTYFIGGKEWCFSPMRVYDPKVGRFTQRDLYRHTPNARNMYLYCSSVTSEIDPIGLFEVNASGRVSPIQTLQTLECGCGTLTIKGAVDASTAANIPGDPDSPDKLGAFITLDWQANVNTCCCRQTAWKQWLSGVDQDKEYWEPDIEAAYRAGNPEGWSNPASARTAASYQRSGGSERVMNAAHEDYPGTNAPFLYPGDSFVSQLFCVDQSGSAIGGALVTVRWKYRIYFKYFLSVTWDYSVTLSGEAECGDTFSPSPTNHNPPWQSYLWR